MFFLFSFTAGIKCKTCFNSLNAFTTGSHRVCYEIFMNSTPKSMSCLVNVDSKLSQQEAQIRMRILHLDHVDLFSALMGLNKHLYSMCQQMILMSNLHQTLARYIIKKNTTLSWHEFWANYKLASWKRVKIMHTITLSQIFLFFF